MVNLGIARRLIVILVIIEIAVMAVIALRGAFLLEEDLQQQAERAIYGESTLLAGIFTEEVFEGNQQALQQELLHWKERDNLLYAIIFNHKMEVLASTGSWSVAEIPVESGLTFKEEIEDGRYHLSLPIMFEGERIGTLKMGYRTDYILNAIEQAQWHVVQTPLLLLLFMIILTLLVGERLAINVRRIEEGIEQYQQGNYDHHISTRTDGLFDNIAQALNQFARVVKNKLGELNMGRERLQESVEALELEIASRTEVEAELRTLQQRLLLQREQSPIGIIDWSTELRVVDWNPAAERIFGYSKEEVLGHNALDLIVSPENRGELFTDGWQIELKQSGGAYQINTSLSRDGRSLTCEWYNTPIVGDDGEVIGVFSLIVDITEKRRQQQMLQRSQKMDALGKLTGGIAHDYNNMLGVVLGYASMLKKMLEDQPKLANYAEQILHAGERGATLSKKLLAFSRNISSAPQQIDINRLLRDEQMMLEKTLTARIKLILDLCAEPWPIWADDSDLVDAILNLSINAMHAMPSGGQLTIQTQNVELNSRYAEGVGVEPGEYMTLSFTDTGIGIEPETQAHIFEPFFTTKGERGSGLGLSQVYGFMQRSGGTIRLYSDLGHGARFALYFPRYMAQTELQEGGEATVEAATDEDGQVSGGNETILVVDDEEGLRMVAAEFLSSAGYQVIGAENGEQALEILRDREVDLLLTDVVMPGMDGYHLAAQVQELYPQVKVQLASGYNDERHQGLVSSELRDTMLYKPFELEALLRRVRELLDRDEHNPSLPESAGLKMTELSHTGIGEIDDDHHVLFELFNRCQRLLGKEEGGAEMSAILTELKDYTIYHFGREELIMAACEYPHLKNHQLVHKMLTRQTSRLIAEFERGELKAAVLFDFMRDWLQDHIMTMDKAIAPYCEGREAEIKEALKR